MAPKEGSDSTQQTGVSSSSFLSHHVWANLNELPWLQGDTFVSKIFYNSCNISIGHYSYAKSLL